MDDYIFNRIANFYTSDRCAVEFAQGLVTKPKCILVDGLKEYYAQSIGEDDAIGEHIWDAVADMLIADWYFANAYHCFDC